MSYAIFNVIDSGIWDYRDGNLGGSQLWDVLWLLRVAKRRNEELIRHINIPLSCVIIELMCRDDEETKG